MIVIAIFVFFSTILAYLSQSSQSVNEIYLKDLIISFAGYARTMGYLPSAGSDAENAKVPWQKIGISQSFFSNLGNIKYYPEHEYCDQDLLFLDSPYWLLKNVYFVDPKTKRKNITMIEKNIAFTLHLNSAKIIITKEMLLKYANFDPEHLKRKYALWKQMFPFFPTGDIKFIENTVI